MTPHHEPDKNEKQEVLTVTIPATLMRDLEAFCAAKDVPVEQFVSEALSEKMNRWKE